MQQSAEIKVGLFVVLVAIFGVVAASNLKGGLGRSGRTYEFEIWFETAPGVGRGSPVRLAGVEIGEVVSKDVVQVTEQVAIGVPTEVTNPLLPFEAVTSWHDGDAGEQQINLTVRRRRLSAEEARELKQFRRERSLARLQVRVKEKYHLYQNYRYQIVGGVVFGDRQLSISDVGADGLPMSEAVRGPSIPQLAQAGRRVAVLGEPPPNLDAIVSNVEKVMDEDTTARVKQIVTNIERATNETSEMVATMRLIVDANQGNADRMMLNLARATEDLQRGIAETRVLTRDVLDRIRRTTAVAQRLSEAEEARLQRIVGNVEAATQSAARTMQTGERRLDSTMADVQAIASQVRDMVASNQARIDQIASQLATTSDNVAALSGDARQRLGSVMASVDESVATVRDLLRDSDEKLAAIIDDSGGLVREARETLGVVREGLTPLAGSMAQTSRHLETTAAHAATAMGNVASLTGDPATRQIVGNVEQTTAEARAMLSDIRSLTADPAMREDIRVATSSIRSVSEKLDHTVGGASRIRPYGFADVYYVPDQSRWQANLGITLTTGGKTSYHFGVDNVTADPVLQGQFGRSLFADTMRFRYGFYRSKLGVGLDWSPFAGATVRSDFHNPEDLQINARLIYRTKWGFSGIVGVEDMFDRWDWNLGARFGFDLY